MTGAARHAIRLERRPYDPGTWAAVVERHPEASVYHSPEWLEFLRVTQGAEPVVATVLAADRPVGHFVGGIVRRFGVPILGSPLRGWTTAGMGFLLDDPELRWPAHVALPEFAFRELRCLHLEVMDRQLPTAPEDLAGYTVEAGASFVVDLKATEESILAGMRATTRNYIRQAQRSGLRVEVATGAEFADEYYSLLHATFVRQGLTPTYTIERVRRLIEVVQPSGQILMLRVADETDRTLATAIVVGRNRTAVLWGAAFERIPGVHPNELLHWEAMRYWRTRGVERYDMGGGGDYKAKFGGFVEPYAWLNRPRFRWLAYARAAVRRGARARQRLTPKSR